MTIAMTFDPAARRLVTTATGDVTLQELLDHIEEEAGADHLGTPELFDARQARTSLSSADIRTLIERMRRASQNRVLGPTALVTANDVVFGMARMYSLLSEGFDSRFAVFRQWSDAVRWLDAGGPPL